MTTYAGDDKSIWKDFRRELIKEGFASGFLMKHKDTIRDHVVELGSRGALDEVGAAAEGVLLSSDRDHDDCEALELMTEKVLPGKRQSFARVGLYETRASLETKRREQRSAE